MSTYAIGDIQGCYRSLRDLLRRVGFAPEHDRLWCVGDLVNRGPHSLDVLRFLRDMDDAVQIVLGNHDLHFIAIHEGCAPTRGADTLAVLLNAPDCQSLSGWLRRQPLAHFDTLDTLDGAEDFLMVHAGVAPCWNVDKTLELAAEAERALQGKDFRVFLRTMYGDWPARWHNWLEGPARLRTITNYLTRARFCDEVGALQLKIKEGPCAAPAGFKPWYEYERVSREAIVVFGHWAALDGHTGKPRVHALDTGCVWGRTLTAMRLEDGRRYAVSGEMPTGRRLRWRPSTRFPRDGCRR